MQRMQKTGMTARAKPVVVGIGEVLWDMLPTGKQLGGAPANFAYHAAKLGAEAHLVSNVGRDKSGREIIAKLRGWGVNTGYIGTDPSHPTGVVEVSLDGKGQPTYIIRKNAAWDFISQSPDLLPLAKRTNAVCFGSLAQRTARARQTILKFVRTVPRSALKIFDINLRQKFYGRDIIRESLAISNILKINDEELVLVAAMYSLPADEAGAAGSLLDKYGLRLVAVTKGGKGSTLYWPNGECSARGRKIKIADTVGAGDAFSAALVMGMLNGLSMEVICQSANRLAEYVCGRPGATPGIPRKIIRNFSPVDRN